MQCVNYLILLAEKESSLSLMLNSANWLLDVAVYILKGFDRV